MFTDICLSFPHFSLKWLNVLFDKTKRNSISLHCFHPTLTLLRCMHKMSCMKTFNIRKRYSVLTVTSFLAPAFYMQPCFSASTSDLLWWRKSGLQPIVCCADMTARGLERGRAIAWKAAGRRFPCGLPGNDTAHWPQRAGDSCWLGFHQHSSYCQPEVKRKTFHPVEKEKSIFMHININKMWKISEESGFKFERWSSIHVTAPLSVILSCSQNE